MPKTKTFPKIDDSELEDALHQWRGTSIDADPKLVRLVDNVFSAMRSRIAGLERREAVLNDNFDRSLVVMADLTRAALRHQPQPPIPSKKDPGG